MASAMSAMELDLNELTQQVDMPLVANEVGEDEPTLVGLEFEDLANAL
jgi:hypothetical protein